MGATFVIGDTHGGLLALEEILEKINLVATDRLIFLGDYVDGWSQSYQLLEYLIKLNKTYDCIFIKGNHDNWTHSWLKNEEPNAVWLHHGGRSTMDSYPSLDFIARKRHLAFFETMLDFYIDSEERLFIHAGFTSLRGPLFEIDLNTLLWDRTLWELALAVDPRIPRESRRYPMRLSLFKEIFIGHTPTTYLGSSIPMRASNVWNLDTGAAFQGKLSAMNIETKEVWQSTALVYLYPNEKGRN